MELCCLLATEQEEGVLYCGDGSGAVKAWDVEEARQIFTYEVLDASLRPLRTLERTLCDPFCEYWLILAYLCEGMHKGPVVAVVRVRDSLVTAGSDGKLILWNQATLLPSRDTRTLIRWYR